VYKFHQVFAHKKRLSGESRASVNKVVIIR